MDSCKAKRKSRPTHIVVAHPVTSWCKKTTMTLRHRARWPHRPWRNAKRATKSTWKIRWKAMLAVVVITRTCQQIPRLYQIRPHRQQQRPQWHITPPYPFLVRKQTIAHCCRHHRPCQTHNRQLCHLSRWTNRSWSEPSLNNPWLIIKLSTVIWSIGTTQN